MQDIGYSDGYAAGYNTKCGKDSPSQLKSDDQVYQRYFKIGYADGVQACEKENWYKKKKYLLVKIMTNKNPFTSPRYIMLSVLDAALIILAVMGYVKLDALAILGEGFKTFIFENWLALGIAGVVIMMLNAFVSIQEHLANVRREQGGL